MFSLVGRGFVIVDLFRCIEYGLSFDIFKLFVQRNFVHVAGAEYDKLCDKYRRGLLK